MLSSLSLLLLVGGTLSCQAFLSLSAGTLGAARGTARGAAHVQRAQQLSMIKRDIKDAKKSKRILYSEFRKLINSSQEFTSMLGVKPDIELWVKANGDGSQVGDCPFAHFVQMVLRYKDLEYAVYPTLANSKPDWLVNDFQGKMPCLVHRNKTIVESMEIAKYLEETFPEMPLTQPQLRDWQEVLEMTKGFFPAVAACLKNSDPSKEAELLLEVEAQTNMLDDLLRETPGRYLCGDEVSMADMSLVPKLYHAHVAMQHFKQITIYHPLSEFKRPKLETYMERMFGKSYFNAKGVMYSGETIVWGWKSAKQAAKAQSVA